MFEIFDHSRVFSYETTNMKKLICHGIIGTRRPVFLFFSFFFTLFFSPTEKRKFLANFRKKNNIFQPVWNFFQSNGDSIGTFSIRYIVHTSVIIKKRKRNIPKNYLLFFFFTVFRLETVYIQSSSVVTYRITHTYSARH